PGARWTDHGARSVLLRRRWVLLLGHDEQLSRRVGVEGDRAQILVGARFVQIDRVSRLIDVQNLAVGARPQRHSRTSRKFSLRTELPVLEVERPEFVVADLLQQPVRTLPIGSEREADHLRRPKRPEVDALRSQVDSSDPHEATVLYRILDEKET